MFFVLFEKGIVGPNSPATADNLREEFFKFCKTAFSFEFRCGKHYDMRSVMSIRLRPHINLVINRLCLASALENDRVLFTDHSSDYLCDSVIRTHSWRFVVGGRFAEVLAEE